MPIRNFSLALLRKSNWTPARWAIALLIAVASDALSLITSFTFLPQLGIDIATAGLIWIALGWHWALLIALIPEALPALSVFPTWTLVILALKGAGMLDKKPGAGPNG
jgi:hypothetical protein